MPIIINQKPDSDFRNPLGLLSDCHRRIERFLGQLIEITSVARGGELWPEQKEALETSLRYFSSALQLHNADEEESLFPRLRHLKDLRITEELDVVDRLEHEHRVAEEAHREVEELTYRWIFEGHLPEEETERLIETLERLKDTYQRHIGHEDNELFPLAQRTLPVAEILEIGREMAHRRGVNPESPDALNRCASRRAQVERLLSVGG